MQQVMSEFLEVLRLEGRTRTADCYALGLANYETWLTAKNIDALKATRPDIERFQTWLSEEYRSPRRQRLGRTTQATRLSAVKSFYKWAHGRGVILVDPAREIILPKVRRTKVKMDLLTQQEVAAMLSSQARYVASRRPSSLQWAAALRNLALLALAIASGRRRSSLLELKVEHLDFTHGEIRIEWEKGKPGRVLPCAAWALSAAKDYIQQARPLLLADRRDEGWLWIGNRIARVCNDHLRSMLQEIQTRASEENPDLEGLATKRLGTHGLRVTFATMLFLNGANIRTVNELLLHTRLTTTAHYTPLALEDVRSALRTAHPRA